jgi:elongation factor 1-beta
LNAFLESRSYVVGFKASATDAALFNALGKAPDAKKYANVARFYAHLSSFTPAARDAFPAALGAGAAASGAAAPKAAAKAKGGDDEDVDLFGDDGEDAAAKVKATAAAAAAAPAKKEKAKPIAKSICVYDIKPMLAETTPAELEAAVRSIVMDGLQWGETFKVEDVGYGIKKLVVQFVCEDEKVSLTDLEDAILAIKGTAVDEDSGDILELVQSVSN